MVKRYGPTDDPRVSFILCGLYNPKHTVKINSGYIYIYIYITLENTVYQSFPYINLVHVVEYMDLFKTNVFILLLGGGEGPAVLPLVLCHFA